MEILALDSLDIGGGLCALRAWVRNSPLVAVEVRDGSGEISMARLDINKQVFIDEVRGGDPTGDGIRALISAVAIEPHTH